MAYATQQNPAKRNTTLAAVALLHIGAIYALVTGLAGGIFKAHDQPLPSVYYPQTTPTKPPEEHVKTKTTPHDTTVTTVRPLIDVTPQDNHIILPPFIPPQTGETGPIIEPLPPRPNPSPLYTAKNPAPLGKPGGWVTPNDYPTDDLRAEHSGITRFRLSIGVDGRVQSCSITASSGWPGLDNATCAKLSQRGRFTPASDENGAKVTGSYASSVRWEIPE